MKGETRLQVLETLVSGKQRPPVLIFVVDANWTESGTLKLSE